MKTSGQPHTQPIDLWEKTSLALIEYRWAPSQYACFGKEKNPFLMPGLEPRSFSP
jgi:hypothetical protein